MSIAPTIKMLDEYLSAYTLNERYGKNLFISAYYNSKVSKQNMEKLSVATFFSFIVGFVDTGH